MATQGDYAYNRRKDPRMRGPCSINCLKYVLFLFDFIFLVAGCAILGVGIWTIDTRYNQLVLLDSSAFLSVAVLCIVAGSIVVITAIYGCLSVIREDRCGLFLYTIGIILVLILEIVAGIVAYTWDLQHDLNPSLTHTFNDNYGRDQDLTNAIDAVQIKYKCCGAISYPQWEHSYWKTSGMSLNNTVPDSCCKTPSFECGIRNHPSNIWASGCIHGLEEEMSDHLLLMGAIAFGLSSINVIGLLFSCCLFFKLKELDNY